MPDLKSASELQEVFLSEFTARTDEVNDQSEGSLLDVISGTSAVLARELQQRIVTEFRRTFFSMAQGADLDALAVDHFGSTFARPSASAASGIVTFSRPTAGAAVTIPAGTVVQTDSNADGVKQQYSTVLPVVLTGLSVNASVVAVTPGSAGNVLANAVTSLESTLLDPTVTVKNTAAISAGTDAADDATYLEFIENKITTLRGGTVAALEAAAKTVSGVVSAKLLEKETLVSEVSTTTGAPIGSSFRIARNTMYVADANGAASPALISAVSAALDLTRGAGIRISVEAALAFVIDWSATLTLNPAGPNYASLVSNTDPIEKSMRDYIANLVLGQGFNLITARTAIMAIWGPAGTGDLTNFQTLTPTGNIAIPDNGKAVPGLLQA